MIGSSIYLTEPLTERDHQELKQLAQAGFSGVFTSLHIPEDDAAALLPRLRQLATWCQETKQTLTADISADFVAKLGWDLARPESILAAGVTALRLDFGVDLPTIARLSQAMPVALNASTLDEPDLNQLAEAGADFSHIEAWHNFYPRPETGLARDWFAAKNRLFHRHGLKTQAFIPGDGVLRGPLFKGLPTLEDHRNWAPLAAMLDLQTLGTDLIYVGDNALSEASLRAIAANRQDGAVTLRVAGLPDTLAQTWHNRPDAARDVIRIEESRFALPLDRPAPSATQTRPLGTLTVDNTAYGRYAGEVQLTTRDLSADEAVNVLGRVIEPDRPLLDFIGGGQALTLVPAPK
ncbi:DUF871 domain-containing protein [Lacticaseibacillus yichunensis]|uniref:DUF871 domain-containing protein n=1 Tax=Lacticaseibacillus yichunensis TaxID=2486015 RepID=A0ABW4CR70_9LACO|nr:MupG family TIM beta-alpha barrel fold protein [Lacticaseibacillus yichunensis]